MALQIEVIHVESDKEKWSKYNLKVFLFFYSFFSPYYLFTGLGLYTSLPCPPQR